MSRAVWVLAPAFTGILIIEACRGERVGVAAVASVASLLLTLAKW